MAPYTGALRRMYLAPRLESLQVLQSTGCLPNLLGQCGVIGRQDFLPLLEDGYVACGSRAFSDKLELALSVLVGDILEPG